LFWGKENGGFSSKFCTLAPSKWPTIVDKHPHDSDHAECVRVRVWALASQKSQIIQVGAS